MTELLKGITWGHSRGYTSIVGVSQRFHELHPQTEITWEKRSLQEFADAPISELAKAYDLLIIDHPWAGYAASTGILLPLEKYIDAAYLADQEKNSVGVSHFSYNFGGFQSALAIDAATPVAVYRPDFFDGEKRPAPATFDELMELAGTGVVAFAGIPINLLMDFYMYCDAAGKSLFASEETVVDDETGCEALEAMRALASRCRPEIFGWDPIGVHEALASDSGLSYCPWAYGYSNYSRPGYAKYRLKAGDVVRYKGKPLRSVLGGTGLAVSSASKYRDIAVEFAEYAASPEIQRTLFFDCGGQPGHRGAWLDTRCNALTLDFFKDTLPTLDRAYLRPRYPGYLYFQDHAGTYVRDYVMNGGDAKAVLEKLNVLYRESRKVKA